MSYIPYPGFELNNLNELGNDLLPNNRTFQQRFDDTYYYNNNLGWRERPANQIPTEAELRREKASEMLENTVGDYILEPVGEVSITVGKMLWSATGATLKFLAYGIGAGAVGVIAWNSYAYVKNEVLG